MAHSATVTKSVFGGVAVEVAQSGLLGARAFGGAGLASAAFLGWRSGLWRILACVCLSFVAGLVAYGWVEVLWPDRWIGFKVGWWDSTRGVTGLVLGTCWLAVRLLVATRAVDVARMAVAPSSAAVASWVGLVLASVSVGGLDSYYAGEVLDLVAWLSIWIMAVAWAVHVHPSMVVCYYRLGGVAGAYAADVVASTVVTGFPGLTTAVALFLYLVASLVARWQRRAVASPFAASRVVVAAEEDLVRRVGARMGLPLEDSTSLLVAAGWHKMARAEETGSLDSARRLAQLGDAAVGYATQVLGWKRNWTVGQVSQVKQRCLSNAHFRKYYDSKLADLAPGLVSRSDGTIGTFVEMVLGAVAVQGKNFTALEVFVERELGASVE